MDKEPAAILDELRRSSRVPCCITTVSRESIEEVGTEVWYLPLYSLDFNPIELMGSKVKNFLRGFAARTKRTQVTAIVKSS